MAVPSYTTDLQLFEDFEAANTVDTEVVGYTATAKSNDEDADFPIQGTQHASAEQRTAATGSLVSDYGSNITWTSGWNLFLWGIFLAPAAVNTDTNAGIEMYIGSSISDGYKWTVGGSDFGRYPYGGWTNFVADPQVTTGRTNVGGGAGTSYRWCGMLCNVVSAITKGSPYGIDVIRFGRGELIVTGGQSGNYATFDGCASANDSLANKWGLFQEQFGTYLWKGKISLGTELTHTEFADSNRNIVVDNTRRVQPTFNRIEVTNASTIIDWENISIVSLGTTSPGDFEMIDNAVLSDVGGGYTDLNTFIYKSNATLRAKTWLRCGQVTQGGADIDLCIFQDSIATAALVSDNPNNIDLCRFTQDATGHAIRLTTTCAGNSYTITGNTFENYNATDGSTGNEGIYNNSGGAVTINVVDGVVPSVRNGSGATTTIQAAVPLTIDVFDSQNASVHNAVVALYPDVATTVIVNATTNKDGRVLSSYNYTSDQTIRVRIRKSSPGDARYIPVATTGVITSDGYTLRQTLIVDSNASL